MEEDDPAPAMVQPVWCIGANVVQERRSGPGGSDHGGMRLFRPGAKLWVVDGFGGDAWQTLTVVGQVRRSPRYAIAHVRARDLTRWRVRLVYSPAAIRQITTARDGHRGGFWLPDAPDPAAAQYRTALEQTAGWLAAHADTDRAATLATTTAPPDPPDDEPGHLRIDRKH